MEAYSALRASNDSDGATNLPMLLDFLTVFFIVASCALLWLNLRRRRIVITKTDDAHQSVPTRHIPDDAEIRTLLAALKPPVSEAQTNPEAEEGNAHADRDAGGTAMVKKPPRGTVRSNWRPSSQ
jgi:hypothetical protein